MGVLNLEERSTVLEGAMILGLPVERVQYLAARLNNFRVMGEHNIPNREIAREIATNAYIDGLPLHNFSRLRTFHEEDYEAWARWRESSQIEIEGFNFPQKPDDNYYTISIIIQGKVTRPAGTKYRDFETITKNALERGVYGSEPFRYGVRKGVVVYHLEDA